MPTPVRMVPPQGQGDGPDLAPQSQAQSSRRRQTTTRPANPKTFAFISVDAVGRSPSDTRKFIRSHVMRGKNTKKRITPVVQEVEPEAEPQPVPDLVLDSSDNSSVSDSHHTDNSSPGSPDAYFDHLSSYDLSALCNDVATFNSQAGASAARLPGGSLPAPPHDMHLLKFPDGMTDPSRHLLYKFMISIKETMYPIEWCFHVDGTRGNWFVWLLRDPAYLQACLFAISALVDFVSNKPVGFEAHEPERKFSRKTQLYLRRTIEMLQQRIQDQTMNVDDATTAIVVNLALASDAADDVTSSQAHVQGLKQMIRMRGGLHGYKGNRELQVKICRVDLAWCIKTGCKPTLYDGEIVWAPFFEEFLEKYPMYRIPPPRRIQHLLQSVDPRLLAIFNDMRAFSSIANSVLKSKKKLDPDVHEQSMVSIQYRLLDLEYSLDGNEVVEEALRTGLLAYEVSLFLYTPGLKNNYQYLRNRLRACIERLDPYDPASADLQLWLFIIGAITLYNPDEPWLAPIASELLEGCDWQDCLDRVKDIMWVDIIHTPTGKCVFKAMQDTLM